MFYPKSKEPFSDSQFHNPDNTYRAAPFWAWNTKLDINELKRQIDIFSEMGFGGYHIHSRVGMATPYLSDDFFGLVNDCIAKGKTHDMRTYLYDEDRWPSGSAGGFVTKDHPEFRQRYAKFGTEKSKSDTAELIAVYDIVQNDDTTISYKRIDENDTAKGTKWYAYSDVEHVGNGWFNYQCYTDLMNADAVAEFLRVTHGSYKKHLGKDFGTAAPSIFTDEPQLTADTKYNGEKKDDFMFPWTGRLCERYKEKYGEDLIDKLPEIVFNADGNDFSYTRYNFHELTTELFAESFSDQYGKWCNDNGIAMTGHIMNEDNIIYQTLSVGDTMRHYRSFTLPGIDMLLDFRCYQTAKQVESIRRQKGAEGVLCELDGVTNWDFDFRHHKLHGDWQAALGVTLRVPHLSWVSMNGEAKRDYPASINYQAAWYKKYHLIEDYFARINTILTRGKADCKIAVLHPIRNIWVAMGTYLTRELTDKANQYFLDMTEALVKNHVDFDFISESNIKFQNAHFENGKLKVQNSEYDVLLIPPMYTLTSDTLDLIDSALSGNGRVCVFGDAPKLADAKPSSRPAELFEKCEKHSGDIGEMVKVADEYRDFEIIENGERSNIYCGQMRTDGDTHWLFFAKAVAPDQDETAPHSLTVKIKGKYIPTEYCCENGVIYKTNYKFENGFTTVYLDVYAHDSIMLKLADKEDTEAVEKPSKRIDFVREIENGVDFELCEDNTLVLDKAEFKLDDGEYEPKEELLRKDNELRKRIGVRQRDEGIAQPWVTQTMPAPTHTVTMKFDFESKIEYKDAYLAIETPEICEIKFNGKTVDNKVKSADDWYVDKCIKKLYLGDIKIGTNEIIVKTPFGLQTSIENMFILGKFGVYDKINPYIDKLPEKLNFSDITDQGLMFYGGNFEYKLGDIDADYIQIPCYRGGMIEVLSNGEHIADIIGSPYIADIRGKSNISLKFYGTRINTFGQLHLVSRYGFSWFGPEAWRTHGREWSYDYETNVQGIIKAPKIN